MNAPLLLFSVFAIATCGLIYELIAGTTASYLLGDSVMQFSTVIGTYLFAMGIGSWLSKYVRRDPIRVFVQVEILVGLIGGTSAALMFVLFNFVSSFQPILYFLVLIIGTLVGIEIPLLMRLLKDRFEFTDLVSRVLSLDYIGALAASILFPLVLLPWLGLLRTGFLFGAINIFVGILVLLSLHPRPHWVYYNLATALVALMSQILGIVFSEQLINFGESYAYSGEIILAKSSPYQRIVLTRAGNEYRLFLNSNLQFSSRDEYRYHEALVHPLVSSVTRPRRVLIIGGGDGLAAREVLKYPEVEHITLVDLDRAVTDLFSSSPILIGLNQRALLSDKIELVHRDAFVWLKEQSETSAPKYDVAIVDLPDPSNFSVGKLYTQTFYRLLDKVVTGGFVVQSTSPYFARHSYWCVVNTLESLGLKTIPYHSYVPSFGEWGYVIASKQEISVQAPKVADLKYLAPDIIPELLKFAPDMDRVSTPIQKLNDQALVRLFEEEWSDYQG